MAFVPSFHPPADENRPALWFVYQRQRLLVIQENGTVALPDTGQLAAAGIEPLRPMFLGTLDKTSCYAADLALAVDLTEPFTWMDLRGLVNTIDDELFWIAGRANHLIDWDRNHQFCGKCGHPTEDKTDERSKTCPACGLVNYPRLSPAVIVAVVKDGKLLLARNKRFRRPYYSVLAGYVEPGETLEQCVRREIREEVDIQVANIRYFGSQPWPFPNSLMVGFVADYAAGRVRVDNTELMEADWYAANDLPRIPPRVSIARQLIEWFRENHGKASEI